jgi:hypothetical protein
VALGALGVYEGGKEVVEAADDGGSVLDDVGSIIHGGLTMGAGGAGAIGGLGTILSTAGVGGSTVAGMLGLGKAGLVLGSGLLGYGAGRLLDKGTDYLGREISETSVGETLGMNRGGSYGISSLIGKGLFGVDKAIGSLWGDESLEYNPETDDPSKVDRSYENTLSWKINQVLEGETNYTGEAIDYAGEKYDAAKEQVAETYNDVKEGAGEMYNEASEYVGDKIEAAKEYIPDIELPDVEYNPMNWF